MGSVLTMPMTLISRTTLTTTAASVTFNSIPQTYQTLKLVVSARGSTTIDDTLIMRINNDSGSNYSRRAVYGIGSSALSYGQDPSTIGTAGAVVLDSYTASTFSSTDIALPNYSSTTVYKPISVDSVTENNATTAYQYLWAGLWKSNSAITSLVLLPTTGTLSSGSTFSLYGVS